MASERKRARSERKTAQWQAAAAHKPPRPAVSDAKRTADGWQLVGGILNKTMGDLRDARRDERAARRRDRRRNG